MNELYFSGFSDEAASTLEGQIEALKQSQIGGMDVRSVDNINVLDLSQHNLSEIKMRCSDAGIVIQSIGSPVNKVDFSELNRKQEIEKLKKAIQAAVSLNTKRVRIFSPTAGTENRNKVLDWMQEMVLLAKEAQVLLLHENDARFFGAYPENAKWLFEQLGGLHFKAAFDFSNTTMIGFDPVTDWLPWVIPYLDTLHIKDYSNSKNQVVAAGEGNARIEEFLMSCFRQKWSGPLTLEPHLQSAGPFGGWSGPELFAYAASKMKEVANRAVSQNETKSQI